MDTGTLQGMLKSISVYGRAPSEHAQLWDDNGDYSKQILKLSELFFQFQLWGDSFLYLLLFKVKILHEDNAIILGMLVEQLAYNM